MIMDQMLPNDVIKSAILDLMGPWIKARNVKVALISTIIVQIESHLAS